MNCQNHPEIPATAYCRTCGKPVCEQCRRDAHGTVFCAEHIPAPAGSPASPPVPATVAPGAIPASYPRSDVSPGLAFFLGFIPGVGAIYNGQYVKGLVHAVIFGVIISIIDSGRGGIEVVMSMLLTAWIFYMAFEAQHTAQKRRNGEPVDEYSSVLNFHGGNNAPVAGIVLVVLGALLLLNTLNLVNFAYLERYWPALLIAAGVYLLYTRLGGEK